jgi:hypothetical protein
MHGSSSMFTSFIDKDPLFGIGGVKTSREHVRAGGAWQQSHEKAASPDRRSECNIVWLTIRIAVPMMPVTASVAREIRVCLPGSSRFPLRFMLARGCAPARSVGA